MKRLLVPFLALAVSFGGIATAQQGRLKVATVDMQALFQAYHKTKETRDTIQGDVERVKKEQEGRITKLGDLEKEIMSLKKQSEDPSLADAKRRELQNSTQVKNQEYQSLRTEMEEFLKRKDRAVKEQMLLQMKEILEEIRGKVQKHAESEGYDYVLDKTGTSTSQVPILLYTKDATDITESLLKTINDGAPAPAEKKEEGK
ncbi:OmpH family outer membrane protein [Haloferula sp. BvORR071]|uniref:OmpH family outer membrane protein n=1 Tax=Haloferula sp. BvORR071 TaxID=1396141 RepID=UPI002240F1CC|nr:OmpH family outer membrane protein [Haloferula sp. BvORR071]